METTAVAGVPEFTERRDGDRVAIALDVVFEGDSQFFAGITGDIGRGGLFVCTYRTLEIGTLVDLSFTLPGGAKIETKGCVRWLRPASAGAAPGIGVSFEALSAEDHTLIDEFCAQRAPLYHDD